MDCDTVVPRDLSAGGGGGWGQEIQVLSKQAGLIIFNWPGQVIEWESASSVPENTR